MTHDAGSPTHSARGSSHDIKIHCLRTTQVSSMYKMHFLTRGNVLTMMGPRVVWR